MKISVIYTTDSLLIINYIKIKKSLLLSSIQIVDKEIS